LLSGNITEATLVLFDSIPKTTIFISVPPAHRYRKSNPVNYDKVIFQLQKKFRAAENIQILLLDHHYKRSKILEKLQSENNAGGSMLAGVQGVVALEPTAKVRRESIKNPSSAVAVPPPSTPPMSSPDGTSGGGNRRKTISNASETVELEEQEVDENGPEVLTEEEKSVFTNNVSTYGQIHEIQVTEEEQTTEEALIDQLTTKIQSVIEENNKFEASQASIVQLLTPKYFHEFLLHHQQYSVSNLEFPANYDKFSHYVMEMILLRKWTTLEQRYLSNLFVDALDLDQLESPIASRGYNNSANNIHLVVHGSTGGGKTAFLSKIMSLLYKEQFNKFYGKRIPIIVRSCGKFTRSKHCYHLIQNILLQLLFLHQVDQATIKELLQFHTFYSSNYFNWSLLNSIFIEYPMILVLDDFHCLYSAIDDSFEKFLHYLLKDIKLHPASRIILSYNRHRKIPSNRDPRRENQGNAEDENVPGNLRRGSSTSNNPLPADHEAHSETIPIGARSRQSSISGFFEGLTRQRSTTAVSSSSQDANDHPHQASTTTPTEQRRSIAGGGRERTSSWVENLTAPIQSIARGASFYAGGTAEPPPPPSPGQGGGTKPKPKHLPLKMYHQNTEKSIEFFENALKEYKIPIVDLDLFGSNLKPEDKTVILKEIERNSLSHEQFGLLQQMTPSITPETATFLYWKIAAEVIKLHKTVAACTTKVSTLSKLGFKNESSPQPTAENVILNRSIEGLLRQYIELLEKKFGKELVTYSLAFVTFAREGLTDQEMQDLLTMKDGLISETMSHFQLNIFCHYLNHVRFPLSLWLLVKNRLLFLFTATNGSSSPPFMHWSHMIVKDFMELKYFHLLKDVSKIMSNYFVNYLPKQQKEEKGIQDHSIVLNNIPIWFPESKINSRRILEGYYHLFYGFDRHYLIGAIQEISNYEILCGISMLSDGFMFLFYLNALAEKVLPPGFLQMNHPPRLEGEKYYYLKDSLHQYWYWINKEMIHFYKKPQESIVTRASNEFTLHGIRENMLNYLKDTLGSAPSLSEATLKNSTPSKAVVKATEENKSFPFALPNPLNLDLNINMNVINDFFLNPFSATKDEGNNSDSIQKVTTEQYLLSNAWENPNSWIHKIVLFDKNRFHGMTSNLLGHASEILCVVWNPLNNRQLATCSNDKTIKVWDIYSEQILFNLIGHSSSINSISWSHRTNLICSGSSDNTIKIWDMAQLGKEIKTLHGHQDWVLCVAWNSHDTQIASGSQDKTIKIWEFVTGEVLFTLVGHRRVLCLAWNNEGNRLASGSDDKTIKIWDITAHHGKSLMSIDAHSESVTCLAWAHGKESMYLASGSEDFSIKIWDVSSQSSGKLVKTLKGKSETLFFDRGVDGHTFYVSSIAWNQTNTKIASASFDQSIKIWDVESSTPKILCTLNGHKGIIQSLGWSKNDQYLATASDDLSIKVWNLEQELTPKPSAAEGGAAIYGHRDRITAIALSPDGNLAVTGSDDKNLIIWDLILGKAVGLLQGHTTPVEAVEWTSDGTTIISSTRHSIKLWDVSKGKLMKTFKRRVEHTLSFALSTGENQYLATGVELNQIKIWELSSGKVMKTLGGPSPTGNSGGGSTGGDANGAFHSQEVTCVSFNFNNKKLCSGSMDTSIKVWDTKKESLIMTFEGHKSAVRCVKWNTSNYHSQIISSSRDNTVKLWDADNGSPIYSLALPGVNVIHWNRDNTHILVGSPSAVNIVEIDTSECVRTFYFENNRESGEFSNPAVVWNSEWNKILVAKNDVIVIYQLTVPMISNNSTEK
jgi:WD40 repeat protein